MFVDSMLPAVWDVEPAGVLCLDVCLALALGCFLVSVVTDNYSQVDKLWSITPWLYVWLLVANGGLENQRLLLMAIASLVWGMRLTLNFARRGGYVWPKVWEGEEDYRWVHVREMIGKDTNPVLWQLFNFGFISVYQHVLLMLTAAPAYAAYVSKEPVGPADWLLCIAVIVLVGLEGLADEQQWVFQNAKHRLLKQHRGQLSRLPSEYRAGFIQSGLFRVCRHPNYGCEQAIWIVFYGFAVTATGQPVHWSGLGALLLVLLFQASSAFSERLTAEKYPLYREYQKSHCRFLPLGTLLAAHDETDR